MSYAKTNGRLAIVARWVGSIICALALIPSALAQTLGAMNPQHADALRPLFCGICVELSSVVWLKSKVTDKAKLVRADEIVIEAATESHLAESIGVAEATKAKMAHVCVGGIRKVSGVMTLPIPEADRGKTWVSLRVHPDGIDGVCLGSLLPIEVFFETVMSDIFARRLKEFDARLSPEKLEDMVRNRLADALAKDLAEMTEQIKRAVVAELKGQPGGAAGGGAGVGTDNSAKVCTSGTLSCPGKKSDQCCSCIDHPGVEGTCDAGATPQSWRPKL